MFLSFVLLSREYEEKQYLPPKDDEFESGCAICCGISDFKNSGRAWHFVTGVGLVKWVSDLRAFPPGTGVGNAKYTL